MKRVLHIVGSMNRAGAETMIMNIYRKIDRDIYQFDFVYFIPSESDYDDEILKLGGKIYRIYPKNGNIFFRYLEFYSLLKKLNNDCIHSHMNINNSMYLSIAYFAGIKERISHSHSTSGRLYSKGLKKFYQYLSIKLIKLFATKYVACGIAAGKYLYPKVTTSNITLVPNAIDVELFVNSRKTQRNFLRKELGVDDETIIITQIGRLYEVKNHNFTIELARFLKERNVKTKIVIVGQGHLQTSLMELVAQNNLLNEVVFLGLRSDIPTILAGTDLMLMPSFNEGFPVVLVESQASGVPSLISDTISPEVDLGLNLVEFASISGDFTIWEEKILKLTNQKEVKPDTILNVLNEKGFGILGSVKKIEKIYAKK